MGFGYLSAAIIALIVLLAFRKYTKDRALWRRVKKNLPRTGAAGRLIVLSAGNRRLPAGTELRVPFEGTLGGSMGCDVCVPYKRVHMRSAFFWVEGTSIGTVASIVPLVIASFPFVSRLVETSIREVDSGVVEAAQSMGATPLQIITKVLIPESMPSLIANATIAATTILGYGAMAGVIGGGGLGKVAINYGYYRYNLVLEIFATALLVVLVQVLQSIGTRLATRCDKRVQKTKG